MFTDIYDVTSNTLYEAKSSASRMSIRLAIGQLLDYARYLRDRAPQLAVLVPVEPDADMLDLLSDLGIGCVFPDGDGFRDATRS